MTYKDDDRFYGRVFGGIGWPSKEPGYGVILGEDYTRTPGSGDRHLYVLAVLKGYDLGELVGSCAEISEEFEVGSWFVRYDPQKLQFVATFNNTQREKYMAEFRMSQAPYSKGPLAYHLDMIKSVLRPDRSILHGLSTEDLAGQLMSLGPHQVQDSKDTDYPALAALGYAVSAMILHKSDFRSDDHTTDDFDWENEEHRSKVTGY